MRDLVDLDRYPLDRPDSETFLSLVEDCRVQLGMNGLFNLPGFVHDEAIATSVEAIKPILVSEAYSHVRRHNIYFKNSIEGLPDSHPALADFETSNRTLCADQLQGELIIRLYEWPPFANFLAAVMNKPALFTMDDPLARVNVMGYPEHCALNWHFDRSEFTTTLLLQAPIEGGDFEYSRDLRSESDPNYSGVADLLEGRLSPSRLTLSPGTLNVFRGKNTAHRVTPTRGDKDRIIAVFSFFEKSGVNFSAEERVGFYGRAS